MLEQVIEPFQNADLNRVQPFTTLNPSAENVAQHIAQQLGELLDDSLAPHARVGWASVTEAPGCKAKYLAPSDLDPEPVVRKTDTPLAQMAPTGNYQP